MIKDSGERTEFDTGAVRDMQEGKADCSLLPLDVINNTIFLCQDNVFDALTKYQDTLSLAYIHDAITCFFPQGFYRCRDNHSRSGGTLHRGHEEI